jgi:hypothetical protein
MIIKTARDLRSSLLGSAFRRASFDGRTVYLRSIMTLRERMADLVSGPSRDECRSAGAHPRRSSDAPVVIRQVKSRNR